MKITYKPEPKIFIAYCLSQHNYEEGKDKPIKDMDIRIDAIQSATDILECISMSDSASISAGWSPTSKRHYNYRLAKHKDELHSDLRPYWSYKDDLSVIDGVVVKGRCIIIPAVLRQQVLDQLHLNHKGIEKTSYSHMI